MTIMALCGISDGIDGIFGIEIKNKEKGKGKHIRQDYRICRISA